MTRKFAFLLAMVLCGTGVVLVPDRVNAQTNLTRAVIQALRNRVNLHIRNRQTRPARVRDQLNPQDALSTDRASRAELRFNDGSLARIGERTLFRFTPKTRRFQLSNGTVLLLIPSGKGRTQINTPNAAAGIRGSALFVRYIPESDTTLIGALTNSQIEVFNQDETQTQPLAAGQLAVVVKDRIERLYEFDLRTFYETSPLVEGLDLSGKRSSLSSDEAIAQVQAETIEAVRSQRQVVGTRFDSNRIAKTPEDNPTKGFSPPVEVSKERVENPNDPIITTVPASEDERPGEVPNKPPEGGETGGGIKQPNLPETPNPIGRGIQKVVVNPTIPPPGTKDEGEQELPSGGGLGEEKPKDTSSGSEGSSGQGQPSPDQGEDSRDRPSVPEPPKGEHTGIGEGNRKSPRIEAEQPERRESPDVTRSTGSEAQTKVPEARPVLPTTPGRLETAVKSPDVAAPSSSFSPPTITGNTDPNPTAIAPVAIIDPVPPAPVVSAPGNPASVPAPPVSATGTVTSPNPPVSSVTQPSPGNTSTTGATPAVDPDPSATTSPIRGGSSPGNTGSLPGTSGASTVDPTPAGTSGSPPSVIAPVAPVNSGNSGSAIDPVAPLPDPVSVTNPTGGPIPVKPGPIVDPVDPVGKTGPLNQPPIDPGSIAPDPSTIINPPTAPVVDPTPIDPGATAPNLPTVIDPPATPVIDPPTVNTPVIDPPVVNTPVIDPPVVNTPVIDPPVVNTPVIDPPVVNTPVIDPPVVNIPAIDPATLPVNNLPIDPSSSISPINNTAPTAVDPNTPKAPIDPQVVDPNAPKAPIDPGAGLPGNANSGNPNGMGNPNPGNPNGNANPGNPNVPAN